MSWIELTGTIFGLLCVWLTARASIWCWPTGIVNTVAFAVMFHDARLYPELITYGVFFAMSVYGWWAWARGGPRASSLPVRRMSRAGLASAVLLVAAGGPALGTAFAVWTDAVLPYLDSMITAASLVAQALVARKLLESWLFWIFVDVLAIGVYASRGLWMASGLYVVFLGMAIAGWVTWKRRV